MLSAIRKLFRPRYVDGRNLPADYEAAEQDGRTKTKHQKAKKKRELVTRVDESGGQQQSATYFNLPTAERHSSGGLCDNIGGQDGSSCSSSNSSSSTNSNSSSSSSSSTSTDCGERKSNSNNTGSSSCSSNNGPAENISCNSAQLMEAAQTVIHSVTEDGDKQQNQQQDQQQQQQQQQQPNYNQEDFQTQVADDYEVEDKDDEDDDSFEEDFNEGLEEDGPVAFIAEPPPKQQRHNPTQPATKKQQKKKQPTDSLSFSKPITAGQLRKSTPQTSCSHLHQHHHSSKTEVDQLLTGQSRKDSVRGNLEELKAAESINYRSVVYEYSFRVKDVPTNMRVFTDPGDRRIEAIARSCGTQILLDRPKSTSSYYETRARKVTIRAPDLHSLEKCCRQFDDRFPHFYVCGGLGPSSKAIKRVYVDDFDANSQQ